MASEEGHSSSVALLLDRGAGVNSEDEVRYRREVGMEVDLFIREDGGG